MRNEDTAEKLAYPNGEVVYEKRRVGRMEVSDDSSPNRNLARQQKISQHLSFRHTEKFNQFSEIVCGYNGSQRIRKG